MDIFDKETILLAKKTKVDLMKYTKFEAFRDFRIDNTQFKNNLEKMNDIGPTPTSRTNRTMNESMDDEIDTHIDSDGSPKAKRAPPLRWSGSNGYIP